ncbi:MAG: alginate lyase family protein [Chloroflexi bacterium]|nr:alginate lyase family protein [Chloroflexota bacterium]
MVSAAGLVNLQRNISFFAARGAAHTLTYGQWRVMQWLQARAARVFDVGTSELLASVDMQTTSELANHFRSRANPVFFFDETNVAEIVARIPTAQKAQTVRAADRICENIFELRGQGPVKFDGRIDWTYCPNGNIDWRWDLNRHAFFDTLGRAYRYTGDERYALKFRELLCDWLARNPARLDQPNWNGVFEVAFRINIWIWALYYFRTARAFDAELCGKLVGGLLTHGRYLDANIELHVPNNHLLLEAKALAYLGILLPEFKEARRWRERGLKLLERQVQEQVCADGVHGERTTLYHRVISGELLELLALMENNRMAAPPGLVARFGNLVEFERALAKPDGTFPLLGDSAATDTHLRFSAAEQALQESDYWLGLTPSSTVGAGSPRPSARDLDGKSGRGDPAPTGEGAGPVRPSAAFPAGGYYLMKAGDGADARYLVFDCGPFGLPAMPNHGHADALSFELYAFGQTLLLDPGFYSTALGLNWRNFFRGTRAHNTVVVDGLDQSELMDARRVYRPARATCLGWISNDEFDFVDGRHDGYERLAEPVTHRRQIFFAKPDYWVVVDLLTGRGEHSFDLYFHMPPRNDRGAGLAIVPLSDGAWQREIVTGATDPIQGWVSFLSGEKIPAPVLRLTRRARPPVQICTVLYPYRAGAEPAIHVSPLNVHGRAADDPTVTALRIQTPERVDDLIIYRAETKARVEFKSARRV